MPYKFYSTLNAGGGSVSLVSGGGGTSFSDVTSLRVSNKDLSGELTVQFFEYLIGSDIMIGQMGAVSIFGHYKISTYAVDPNDAQYYILTLNHIGSNGSLVNDYYYDIFNFTGINTVGSASTTANYQILSILNGNFKTSINFIINSGFILLPSLGLP